MTDINFNRLTPELLVSNIEQSKLFYVTQLGFSIEFERQEDQFVLISYEGSQFMLEEDHAEAWVTDIPTFPRGNGINFQIEVNFLHAIISKIKKYKIPYFREPKEQWYRINNSEEGVIELLIQDPDGYLLRFQQYLGERGCSEEAHE